MPCRNLQKCGFFLLTAWWPWTGLAATGVGSYIHPIPSMVQSTSYFSDTHFQWSKQKQVLCIQTAPPHANTVCGRAQSGWTETSSPDTGPVASKTSTVGTQLPALDGDKCPDCPQVPQTAQALRARSLCIVLIHILNSCKNWRTWKSNQTLNLFTKIRERVNT